MMCILYKYYKKSFWYSVVFRFPSTTSRFIKQMFIKNTIIIE